MTDQIDASWTTATTYSLGTSSPLAFLASFALTDPNLQFTAWTADNYTDGQLTAEAVYYAIPAISLPAGSVSPRNAGGLFLGTSMANDLQTSYGYENYGVATDMGRTGSNRPTAPSPAPSTTGAAPAYRRGWAPMTAAPPIPTPRGGSAGKTAGNNMVEITKSADDADDNLVAASPADANTSYTTYYQYDWRDRQDGHGRS